MTTSTRGEITIVPFADHGHVFPATELAHLLASRNYHVTLLLPSSTSSPSTAAPHPLIHIIGCEATPEPHPHNDRSSPLRDLLTRRTDGRDPSPLPVCVIIDVMMHRELEICKEFSIPAVSFFTSSACSTAFDHAKRKISPDDLRSREILTVPGLPDDMSITISDLAPRRPPPPPQHGRHPPPPPPFGPVHPQGVPPPGGSQARHPPPFESGHLRFPPPPPGGHPSPYGPPQPPGLEQTDGAIALLFNTCDDLERPFIEYIASETKTAVWAVGPLLPARFWEASLGSAVIHDDEIRPKRDSSHSEKDIIQWLDSKPRGSVIYVSFGTVVDHEDDELAELAAGLEESSRPFIWVLKAGSETSRELARRAGDRGLVVEGWAPQLLILSHESTGGFISHCGWNSTVEAIGLGVPMLTWPVHGDQVYNAKLVTSRLKTGYAVADGSGATKDDVVQGIERLMEDVEMRARAAALRATFKDGFPQSSSASLDAFLDFLNTKLM